MSNEDLKLTLEEIKKGCSAYIDHGGIGFYCRWKPALKRYGKIYCKRHDPIRTKMESDRRSGEYIKNMRDAEQHGKDSDQRLREAGAKEERERIINLMDEASKESDDHTRVGNFVALLQHLRRQALKEGVK